MLHAIRYYLLNYENVTYFVLMKVLKMGRNYNYPGILYVKAYISFISTAVQTVCFCLKLGSFYLPFTTIKGRKGQFLSIFTSILKQSHLDLSKLSLFTNDLQHKLTCYSTFLTSRFQHGRRDYLGALKRNICDRYDI